MKRKVIVSMLLMLALASSIGALAATKGDFLYKGKTSSGKPVALKIGFTTFNNSTWVTYMSFGYPVCGSASQWSVNGGVKVNSKTHGFSYQSADPSRNGGGYTDVYVVHGKVSGWDAGRKAWKKASGTFRRAYGQPAYSDDVGTVHPAYHCGATYNWSATRRG